MANSAFDFGAAPHVRVRHSTDQTIASGSFVAITFDTEDVDSDAMHDPGSNPTRLTATTAGFYIVGAEIQLEAGGGTERAFRLRVSGTSIIANLSYDPAIRNFQATTAFEFAANDYVEALVFQDSGGDLDCQAVAEFPLLWMVRVA